MVKYNYDAWGKCIVDSSTTNTELANLTPFRYRSYYYDTETNLYFLKTRYYDPEVGRFITIDDLSYCSNSTKLRISFLGENMKKIISSKNWLLINLSGTLCFCYAFLYSLYMFLRNIILKSNIWPIFFLLSIFSFSILVLFVIALNRLSCIIWYDDKSIGRKGLLFGFRHQIDMSEIQDVIIVTVPKQGRYVVIIDDYCNNVEGLSKRSYIRFEYTKKSKEFYTFLCRANTIK